MAEEGDARALIDDLKAFRAPLAMRARTLDRRITNRRAPTEVDARLGGVELVAATLHQVDRATEIQDLGGPLHLTCIRVDGDLRIIGEDDLGGWILQSDANGGVGLLRRRFRYL